ncbi:MAG: hypothetical protein ACRD0W_09195, partial [Acidimicrobiales bacterium]
MSDVTLDTIAADMRQRLDGIGEDVSNRLSDVELTKLVREVLAGWGETDEGKEWARKLRFGTGNGGKDLIGTKYARWGLGAADIEFLHDLQVSLRGQKKVAAAGVYDGPSQELAKAFGDVSEAYYMPQDDVRQLDRKAIDDLFPRLPLALFHGRDRTLAARGAWEETQVYRRASLAMDTAESGFGQQLVGAQYVGELWEAARRESRIFALIESFEMTDPTAFLPVEVDIPELLFVGESTTFNATNYATVKTGSQRVQVDAKKFLIHQMWSGEMEEDSIIPFVPFLRRQAAASIGHYSDSAVLNGDTTNAATGNINLDDADPADTKHYLAFDGIRHASLVDNTANDNDAAGAPTLELLHMLRSDLIDTTRLVDWGHPADANDLVYVSDPETGDRVALIDEVLTVDKYGPQATVLTGEVLKIARHPHVVSMAMSKTEIDGKVSTTGANNTKGQVSVFNRRGFKTGWRRRVQVETER